MEQWFEGKVALVTGGADGIGRAAALLFAQRGAKVVVTDINTEKGEAVATSIREMGGDAFFVRGNVTDRSDVAAFVQATVDRFGRLDCAFNNAGITHPRDTNWDDDAFDLTVDINLKGVWNSLKEEVPVMLKTGGGTIVNTASIAAFIASVAGTVPAYTATKHGIVGLTKATALQYVRQNIRVNAICPGPTATEAVRAMSAASEEARHMLENLSPMGRLALPEEMAEAAIWLCSDKSTFVTGHALVIDGGAVVA
ncbi:glucose 1-dehydrogenase (plasmid) [Agrobacterium leguminum]|uniref:glucose 1-dehydrogenase n=1 Tax=Agrobacterium leguminum TaxID=2792015 RepID=UPI0030D0B0F6